MRKMTANQTAVIGASVLETLTTGMYTDPIIIYREYIQNACDAIDQAVREGLLPNKRRQGSISICIDTEKRYVSIEDNGAGVPAEMFHRTVGDIANSAKEAGRDKGFRGIGRLAGLAYCKKLVFTTRTAGERSISRLECDAIKFCAMVNEKGHTAAEVLAAAFSFSTEDGEKEPAHFFRVEMIDVVREADALLARDRIRSYLSFVAPAAFDQSFYQRNMISDYVVQHNFPLDEYGIILDGQRIFKAYRTNYSYRDNKPDSIQDLAFKELRAKDGTILAWLWYAHTGFLGAIQGKDHELGGIRVRVGNIQIGDKDSLRSFYPEARFAGYVLGELHVLPSARLRPNARRDYFNNSPQLTQLEEAFREIALEIKKLCRDGSDMNTYLSDIRKHEKAKVDFEKKDEENRFLDVKVRQKAEEELKELEKKAKRSEQQLKSIKELGESTNATDLDLGRARIAKARLADLKKEREADLTDSSTKKSGPKKVQKKDARRTDNLAQLSKKEKKMVDKIYRVVESTLVDEPATAERVIAAIEAALR